MFGWPITGPTCDGDQVSLAKILDKHDLESGAYVPLSISLVLKPHCVKRMGGIIPPILKIWSQILSAHQ